MLYGKRDAVQGRVQYEKKTRAVYGFWSRPGDAAPGGCFKGISSYTDTQIRLITRQGKICVTGRHLKIESYSRDEIEISGIIDKLEYQ